MSETVRIRLGRSGKFALIDAADAERVLAFKWHIKRKRSEPNRCYAQRDLPGRRSKQALPHFILGVKSSQWIDHRNGDGLDNRRENLRPCTPRQNATNVTSSKRQKLGGYKGVTWNPSAAKWQASICAGEIKANGKRRQLYLGCFRDPAAAARAYDAAAVKHFGEFASLNFPAREVAA